MTSKQRMPVLFIGHGNPMNAIEETPFAAAWREVALTIPRPRAILSISAHWDTGGSRVTAMKLPRTIHDFYGFPEKLFQVQYPTWSSGTGEPWKKVESGTAKLHSITVDKLFIRAILRTKEL